MKKSRYTVEQVIATVKQMEAGRKTKELARDRWMKLRGLRSK